MPLITSTTYNITGRTPGQSYSVEVRAVDTSGNEGPGVAATLPMAAADSPELSAYEARVIADGGTLKDRAKVAAMFDYLTANALLSTCKHLSSPLAGVKTDANGNIEKLYSLDPANNDAKTTNLETTKRPALSGATAVYDGVNDYLGIAIGATPLQLGASAGAVFVRFNAALMGRMVLANNSQSSNYVRLLSETQVRVVFQTAIKDYVFASVPPATEHRLWIDRAATTQLHLNGVTSATTTTTTETINLNQIGQYRNASGADADYQFQGQVNTYGVWAQALTAAQRTGIEAIGL